MEKKASGSAGSPGRIRTLDSFRGIAALSVIFFHVFNRLGYNQLNFGLTGVDLFFIISGFVIFLTLHKSDSWKVFVASRIARLYPVYWTCVTITAVLILVQTGAGNGLLKQYLFNMTMFQNYFKVPHLDFPYWTLVVEMQFYVFMLVLFQLSWLDRIEIPCILLCAGVIIYGTLVRWYAPALFHFMNNAFPLLNHFPLFFAGILFYQLKFGDPFSRWRWALVAACFFLALYEFDFNDRANFLPSGYVFTLVAYFGLFSLFVLKENWLAFLRPLAAFGTISYSLYLIHQYLSFNVVLPFLQEKFANNIVIALLCIAFIAGVASILTWTVEKPSLYRFRNWLLKRLRYKRVQPVVAAGKVAG